MSDGRRCRPSEQYQPEPRLARVPRQKIRKRTAVDGEIRLQHVRPCPAGAIRFHREPLDCAALQHFDSLAPREHLRITIVFGDLDAATAHAHVHGLGGQDELKLCAEMRHAAEGRIDDQ